MRVDLPFVVLDRIADMIARAICAIRGHDWGVVCRFRDQRQKYCLRCDKGESWTGESWTACEGENNP